MDRVGHEWADGGSLLKLLSFLLHVFLGLNLDKIFHQFVTAIDCILLLFLQPGLLNLTDLKLEDAGSREVIRSLDELLLCDMSRSHQFVASDL